MNSKKWLTLGLSVMLCSSGCAQHKDPIVAKATELPLDNTQIDNLDIDEWQFDIYDIQLVPELVTVETIVLYTGDTEQVTHSNRASLGQYLLIDVGATKLTQTSSSFNISDVSLQVGDIHYKQANNEFLKNHDYTPFTNSEVRFGKQTGFIVFELPTELDLESAKLNVGEQSIIVAVNEVSQSSDDTNIPVGDSPQSLIDKQWEIEQQILADYALAKHTPESPYVIVDPYGWAPLSALVIFDTVEQTQVALTVCGKDEHLSISHTFEGFKKYHEIPIIGLYANTLNHVQLHIEYKDGQIMTHTIEIPIGEVSSDVAVNIVTADVKAMADGVTMLSPTPGEPSVIDAYGDLRWKLDYEHRHVLERLKNGNLIITDNRYGNVDGGVDYRRGVFEVDMLGKIYSNFSDYQAIHHDVIELPNGNLLTTSYTADAHDRILELDRDSGEVINSIKHLQPINSMCYESDSIIISSDNDVAKVAYPSGELQWVLTTAENAPKSNKVLTAVDEGFKYPVGQSVVKVLPNDEPNVVDILLYDNNLDSEYSQVAQLRINEANMTVEDVWNFGEELGASYRTDKVGDIDYLDNGNVLATFGSRTNTDETIATIFEINKETKDVVYEMDIISRNAIYRAQRLSMYPQQWDFELGKTKGEVKAANNKERTVGLDLSNIDILPATPIDELTISNIELTDELNISGFSNLVNAKYKLVLVNSLTGRATTVNLSKPTMDFKRKARMDIKYDAELVPVISDELDDDILVPVISDELSDSALVSPDNMELLDQFQSSLGDSSADMISYAENITGLEVPQIVFDEQTIHLGDDFAGSIPLEYLENNLSGGGYKIGILAQSNGQQYYNQTEYHLNIGGQQLSIMDLQALAEANIRQEYNAGHYTIETPYTIVNPYGTSPLTALVMFHTENPASISIEIEGRDLESTIAHIFAADYKTEHQIPIYGLYPGTTNCINLTATYENGHVETSVITLRTEAIKQPYIYINTMEPEDMAGGLTLIQPDGWLHNALFAIDHNGDIRYYNSALDRGNIFCVLDNGLFIMNEGNKLEEPYYWHTTYVTDYLGKVYKKFHTPGINHDIIELPSGNLLYISEHPSRDTIGDYLIELDRKTGEVVHTWDLMEILQLEEYVASEVYVDDELQAKRDWLHINSVFYDKTNNALIISATHQDLVISLDYGTKQINWLLSPTVTSSPHMLTPVGSEFEYSYGSHAASINSKGNLILFDNGNNRTTEPTDNYSRIVEYKINESEMTVEQVYQYGKGRGEELFSTYMSDVDELAPGHLLASFSGIIKEADGTASEDILILLEDGQPVTKIIEILDGKVIYEVGMNINAHRAERITLYEEGQGQDIIISN
ncbi:MAG: hypothetical protein ATN33_02410 [Epulopiscium sp. Nele67-Bin001]|nr:MAG: hypothetical protein ATN33_02410 [Epulopiscium sp. Nele67-Bin001]